MTGKMDPTLSSGTSTKVDPMAMSAWGAVIVAAAMMGFYLGQKQNDAVMPNDGNGPLIKNGVVVLTERTISDIAKKADQWVVTVETDPTRQSAEPDQVVPQLAPNPLAKSAGTGMVFRSDGYIVTSNHVIGINRDVAVVLNNHKRYLAKIIGRDWFTDVAVLKIDAGNLPVATFNDKVVAHPGDWAVAIGTPMRLDHTVSLGIVSAVGRTVSDTSVPGTDLIQTDAAINPGNSGGPLLNIRGQVIGMTTAMHRMAQNIAFAVPVDVVDEVAQTLINEGKVARGYLGLYMGNAHDNAPPPENEETGVYVIQTVKDGPAAKAGLFPGDIIKAVDGKPVKDNTDIRRVILPLKPGDHVTMTIMHMGQLKDVSVSLGQAPERDRILGQ